MFSQVSAKSSLTRKDTMTIFEANRNHVSVLRAMTYHNNDGHCTERIYFYKSLYIAEINAPTINENTGHLNVILPKYAL
jgi:hypothetical protein